MTTVVLGAGAVGTATAWYLKKAGHDVEVVERQPAAALETSWGNGGVIHASEVEPWSQPGMPRKILKWLGKEDAPLLLRYGAIPRMWRWGLEFALPPGKTRIDLQAELRASLEVLVRASASLSAKLRLGPLKLALKIDASAFAQLVAKLCGLEEDLGKKGKRGS